ncbi:hypothetical protein HDU91_007002 [Kappamyces sp. JEL0680]|nr:hypothetical protein HDU91_007002 [Kappamyces sp. JEL0680]
MLDAFFENPAVLPRKGTVEENVNVKPHPRAIEFFQTNAPGEWPEHAGSTEVAIYGELVSAGTAESKRIVYQLHGGAYVLGSAKFYRRIAYFASKTFQAKVWTISYRKAPLNPYPCGLIDAVSGYMQLLETHDAKDIVVMGDSAGGGLALAMLLAVRDMGLPLPLGAYVASPWVDLTSSHPSFANNRNDILPEQPYDSRLGDRLCYYAPNEHLKDPYVSPLYDHLENLCPLLIQVGGIEKLYDEVLAFAKKAGGSLRLQIFEQQIHCHQQMRHMKGAKAASQLATQWFQELLQDKIPAVGKREAELYDFNGVFLHNVNVL